MLTLFVLDKMKDNIKDKSEQKVLKGQFDRMTKTPVPALILMLSVPTIISMLVTNIYNLVDTAFVGQLGNSASGAVGIVFGFMSILQAIGFLFGQGSGSILSRRLGEGDVEGASQTASVGFFSALTLAVITEIICLVFLHPLVMMLGSTETIAPYAQTYIFYILLAAPFMSTSFTLNNILRYEGKAALGMRGLLTGAVMNIAGDAILMFGLKLGIAGAGISTAISQIASFAILLGMFLRGKTVCRLSFKVFLKGLKQIPNVTTTGFPSLLRQGLSSITTVMLNSQAAVYGDVAVAAMSIVSRVMFFVFSIAIGIGQGFQPVSGFNYGAKRYDRVKQGYKFTILAAEILMSVFCIAIILNPDTIIRLFRDDDMVVQIGARALVLQGLAQLFMPFTMVTEMLFQSTGKRLYATLLSGTRSGLFFIPALLILANLRGLSGIQEAQPVAFVASVIPTIFLAAKFFKEMPKEECIVDNLK